MATKAFPYFPGHIPPREYAPELYNYKQEAIWQAINTAYFAWVEGRTEQYRPTPGKDFDMEKFYTWQDKAVRAWATESFSRGRKITRGITVDDFPENLWLWLYERLLLAGEP